jgi:hypothetical protein
LSTIIVKPLESNVSWIPVALYVRREVTWVRCFGSMSLVKVLNFFQLVGVVG